MPHSGREYKPDVSYLFDVIKLLAQLWRNGFAICLIYGAFCTCTHGRVEK